MENSKTPQKYSAEWYSAFLYDQDTQYYGVFTEGEGESFHVLVDLERHQEIFRISDTKIKENMKEVLSKQSDRLFHPSKKGYFDYNINVVIDGIGQIRRQWEKKIKPLFRILSEICGKQFFPGDGGDDELLRTGIIDHEEAMDRAMMKTWLSKDFAEIEKNEFNEILYTMFFHQLASQIEGLILKILTQNGYEDEAFSRKLFYKFKPELWKKVEKLEGHTEFDKLYTIWCFLKHNTLSMYNAMKKKYPESLKEEAYEHKKETYEQGEKAIYEIIRAKFPEVMETDAYGQGEYAIYVALQTKCPESIKPEVPKSEVYELGVISMYKALLSRFPELQNKICDQGELETYTALLTNFPDLEYEQKDMARRKALRDLGFPSDVFEQGKGAWRFVKFSDELIESILTGVERFLIEYCRLSFGEDEIEARWNSEEHFYKNAMHAIREEQDPMGIDELW